MQLSHVTIRSPTYAPSIIGLFALAQVAGFAAVFAPAGIGVREGVFLLGLSSLIGDGNAIVAAGACRLWQTFLDLLLGSVGWFALRRVEKTSIRKGKNHERCGEGKTGHTKRG